MDWDAVRAEYIAGGVSQRALAARYGVSCSALTKRAVAEHWTAARAAAQADRAAGSAGDGMGEARAPGNGEAEKGRVFGGGDGSETGNTELAARLRRKLLARLERVLDATEAEEKATEVKTQDAGGTKLFKLRDLTAAYKDIAGDLAKAGEADVEDLGVLDEIFGEG